MIDFGRCTSTLVLRFHLWFSCLSFGFIVSISMDLGRLRGFLNFWIIFKMIRRIFSWKIFPFTTDVFCVKRSTCWKAWHFVYMLLCSLNVLSPSFIFGCLSFLRRFFWFFFFCRIKNIHGLSFFFFWVSLFQFSTKKLASSCVEVTGTFVWVSLSNFFLWKKAIFL